MRFRGKMYRNNELTPDFTLRFPFQLGKGIDFPNITKTSKNIGRLSFSLFHQSYFYVMEIKGFESEQAAKEYFNRIWAGMVWFSLNTCIPFSAETIFGDITYARDPEKAAKNLSDSFGIIDGGVDGLASGDQCPLVFPSNKHIPTISVNGSISSSSHLSFNEIFTHLIQVINAPKSSEIILDSKLKTAIELYLAHYYELTQSAKFLTLIMALEVLFNEKPKANVALNLLNQWESELKKNKDQLNKDTDDYKSLDDLKRELCHRKKNSKRSQLRCLIYETFSSEDNVKEIEKKAVSLYDKRSVLVHKGTLPQDILNSAVNDTKNLVEMIIKVKFRRTANIG